MRKNRLKELASKSRNLAAKTLIEVNSQKSALWKIAGGKSAESSSLEPVGKKEQDPSLGWFKKQFELNSKFLDSASTSVQVYVESDEFEHDLNNVAERLGLYGPDFMRHEDSRWIRIRAKAQYVFARCQGDILIAAHGRHTLAVCPFQPRLALTLALFIGGARNKDILIHCTRVFKALQAAA